MPHLLVKEGGLVYDSQDQHVVMVLAGHARVAGADGKAAVIGPGEGAYWAAGEQWHLSAEEEPLVYMDADGPALRLEHFAITP